MKKLAVGVIGTGFWGKNHARIYNDLTSTELKAICDIDWMRAKAVGKQFGVKSYKSSSKMLKNERIEAVSVCTWSTRLAVEARKALEAGKHVLVEKPMANRPKQAEELVKISETNELHLTVGFLMRFIPGLQNIRESIENNRIGELVCATAKRVSQWPERIGDIGVVKDTAIHDIDVMRYISNEDPNSVYAKTGSMKHRKFEDYAQIMLTYKDGGSAFLESNWLTPYKTRVLTVTGTKAIMKLDFMTQELWIEKQRKNLQPRYSWQEPLKLELQHFADCILKRQNPLITGIDGVKALKIAEAALLSSAKNRSIKL